MPITCTRCDGTGFLNIEEVPEDVADDGIETVMKWLEERNLELKSLVGCSCHIMPPCPFCELSHNVSVCDCCGDGDRHYGVPGEHYNREDPKGPNGPYRDNGGLCSCN